MTRHNYFTDQPVTYLIKQRLKAMDIYQIATTFWDQSYTNTTSIDPIGPDENPIYDPRPEVPYPDAPEETPPFEREPETPPIEPTPELPPVEPIVPETEPLTDPGTEPEIPAFM